jgi:hypothetical protein
VNEEQLRQLLRDAPVPDEAGAEERGLRVVRAALAQEELVPRAPARRGRPLLALGLGLLCAAFLLTPAGADVRDWIGDRLQVGEERPAPALTRLPSGGRLLVQSASGPWVVSPDGSKRRLGSYDEATWSPSGLFVGVARGRQLTAVEPDGDVRWSLSQSEAVSGVRWAPSGYRIAYLSGDDLRVIAGDGTEDRLVDRDVARLGAAWQPDLNPIETETDHVLAYADRGGAVRVINADLGIELSNVRLPGKIEGLEWSRDGQRLLVAGTERAWVVDPGGLPPGKLKRREGPADGEVLAELESPPGATLTEVALAPRDNAFAVLRALPPGVDGLDRSELVVVRTGEEGLSERRLLIVSGALTDLAWSPDASRILVAWRDGDQWLFVPARRGRTIAVGNIGREFNPAGGGSGEFPSIAGWCCAPPGR